MICYTAEKWRPSRQSTRSLSLYQCYLLAGLTLRYDRGLRGAGIDYVQLDTSQPLDFALLAYLAARQRRK